MIPSIYKVIDIESGSLHVMPKPSSDWLADDIQYFKSIGISKIFSLLEQHEINEMDLLEEPSLCQKAGIQFQHYPVKDRSVPSYEKIVSLSTQLLNEIKAGTHLAIHCRGGIGRSGILASCILIEFGYDADDAISLISSARQCPTPDTEEQIKFIDAYAKKNQS